MPAADGKCKRGNRDRDGKPRRDSGGDFHHARGNAGGVTDRAPVSRDGGQEDKRDQASGADSCVTAVVSATWAMKPTTFHVISSLQAEWIGLRSGRVEFSLLLARPRPGRPEPGSRRGL